MRALTIVYILLACTVAGFSQTTATYDNVRARQQLTLNGHTLTSVLQTIDSLSTHAQGVTAKAVYDYIATKYNTVSAGTGIDVVKAGSNYTISLDTLKRLHFRSDSTYSGGVGTMRWNLTDGTLDLGLLGGNVTLQLGQESVQRVKHADNSGLVQGKVVYLVGSDGTNPTVRYARANTDLTSANTFGVMTEDATGGSKAFCTTFGLVRNINTNNLTEGGLVWLSKDTAGALTAVRPTAPNHGVEIGFCIRKHATQGVVFVTVQNGYELNELHDVYAPSPSNNQGLLWKSANSRWEAVEVDTSLNNEGKLRGFSPNNNFYFDIRSSTTGSVPITLYRGTGIGFDGYSGSPDGGNLTINNLGDLDNTNEGILGVGAGTGGSAIITSNTSGANGVSIQQGNNISIGEVTSSNGGMIQISTNAGLLGVEAGTSTTSVITSNTVASTGVTLAAGTGMSISETTSSNGGSITLTNSSPDQTVSISNGGGVGVTGTYPSFTLTATDQSASNEGTLGVGSGTSTSSVITSNTSGASGVTLNAGGGISISETTSSNGGSINISATDQSVSNEGILGVVINPGADAWLSSNTSTANNIGLVAANNMTITSSNNSNGGQIVFDSKAQIDTFSLSGQTLRASLLNDGVAASSVTLPIVDVVAGTNVTVSKANGVATVSATGGGGGGTPAGSTGEIQYNNAGAFGASANLAWDNAAVQLNIGAPSSPTGKLNVKGGGASSSTVNFRLTNSGNTELLKVLDNGDANIGTGFNWISSTGRLGINSATPSHTFYVLGTSRLGNVLVSSNNLTNTNNDIYLNLSNGVAISGSGGTITPSARLHVRGSNASGGTSALLVQNSNPDDIYKIENNGKISYLANAISGTTGNQTIDRPSGNVNFAAGTNALTVTNALCTTSSLVFAMVRTNDATAQIKNVVPGAGSFTINLVSNATNVTSVGFFIIN